MTREYAFTDAQGRKMTGVQVALYHERVPVASLQEGHLYLLHARNAHVGIYKYDPDGPEHAVHSFDIPRNKFNRTFIDNENDFDATYFATAIPLRDLGPAPTFTDDVMKLEWLVAQREAHKATYKEVLDAALLAWKEVRDA